MHYTTMHLSNLNKMIKGIPQRWRLLSGESNWKNLLNPLDPDLQRYLLHYGAMAQATYDTFNSERLSPYAGTSRYSRKNLFSRVGLVKANPFKYEAVKYIYATSNIGVPESFLVTSLVEKAALRESNWIGFVAVATDEGKVALGRRDILVAWRGSIQPIEWVKDFEFPLVSASKIVGASGGNANVHQGFLSIYTSDDPYSEFTKTSARDQVLSEVKKQVSKYEEEEISITVTGHSLGGALSTLNAADIVCNGHNMLINQANKTFVPVTGFTFASPKVGDSNFNKICESRNDLHVLRTHNLLDIVPHLPPIGFTSVGVEMKVDSTQSTFLKETGDFFSWHNLEAAYLHSLALTRNGVLRDIALVNKGSSDLKDKYHVPTDWWCEKNKGMVQEDDGTWKLLDHEEDEDYPK